MKVKPHYHMSNSRYDLSLEWSGGGGNARSRTPREEIPENIAVPGGPYEEERWY